MSRVIGESEFREALLRKVGGWTPYRGVTGPGRSGAVASVYASHAMGIPWLPYGRPCPDALRPLLIVDTATKSGGTLRKAARKYDCDERDCVALFDEPPRLRFWYETAATAAQP